jgi:hypothetical protein
MMATDLAGALAELGIALPRLQPGSYRVTCPQCRKGPRDEALGVTISNDDSMVAHCFRCDWRANWFPRQEVRQMQPDRRPAPTKPATPKDWSAEAEGIWARGVPIVGTVVETYLRGRGCAMPDGDDIRLLRPFSQFPWPRMVARVTDAVTGLPASLHFTSLKLDGSGKAPVPKQKLLLGGHRKAGGVIRLTDAAEVTAGLGVAEGIETALSVMAGGWRPVWAAIDAGNIAAFPVLDGVESLTVFADHDPAGLKAAQACQARWRQAGRESSIVAPPTAGADWNDAREAANG